ncbi:hypothetical protein NUACC21_07100 [Scytonema sp. NUACC21]
MAKNLNEIMQKLPSDRVEKIEARAAELIAKYMTLQDIRQSWELTQEQMAETIRAFWFSSHTPLRLYRKRNSRK